MAAGARLRTLAVPILARGGPASPAGGQTNFGGPIKPRIGNCATQAFSFELESRECDLVMPMFTTNGHFQAAGLKTIERSFKALHLVDSDPDMSKLYTEAYLPKD